MSLFDWLSVISIIIATISMAASFYFWRFPTNTNNRANKIFEDKPNNVVYVLSKNHKGWVVSKILTDNVESNKTFKYIADKKNNPKVRYGTIDNLEQIKSLNYREER